MPPVLLLAVTLLAVTLLAVTLLAVTLLALTLLAAVELEIDPPEPPEPAVTLLAVTVPPAPPLPLDVSSSVVLESTVAVTQAASATMDPKKKSEVARMAVILRFFGPLLDPRFGYYAQSRACSVGTNAVVCANLSIYVAFHPRGLCTFFLRGLCAADAADAAGRR